MTTASLPCIVCRRTLDDAFADQDFNQPADATMFRSHGNYGSTVFDPGSTGERLDVNICDECLIAAARDGIVGHTVTKPVHSQATSIVWTPGPVPATGVQLDPQPGLDARRTLARAIRERTIELGSNDPLNAIVGHPLEGTLWLIEVGSLTATLTDEALTATDEWMRWTPGTTATILDTRATPTSADH